MFPECFFKKFGGELEQYLNKLGIGLFKANLELVPKLNMLKQSEMKKDWNRILYF